MSSSTPQPPGNAKGPPLPLKKALDLSPREYAEFIEPVWTLHTALVGRLPAPKNHVSIFASLLNSMRETHEPMRAILRSAEEEEKKSGRPNGRFADAVLLARPQIESVFIGLLLLHDEKRYLIQYQKAEWVSRVQRTHYDMLRMSDTATDDRLRQVQRQTLAAIAQTIGVTELEAKVALADLTGEAVSAEDKRLYSISPLPNPSEIVNEKTRLLAGSVLEPLGDLLWRHWKFMCDPTHVGMPMLVLKGYLRDDPVDTPPGTSRTAVISHGIVHDSITVSVISIVSLATAIVVKLFRSDVSMLKHCSTAWDTVRTQTLLGSLLWDGWARAALGLLDEVHS